MTKQQAAALLVIRDAGPSGFNRLSERRANRKPVISRRVETSLEEQGLIERHPGYMLTLTAAGVMAAYRISR